MSKEVKMSVGRVHVKLNGKTAVYQQESDVTFDIVRTEDNETLLILDIKVKELKGPRRPRRNDQ